MGVRLVLGNWVHDSRPAGHCAEGSPRTLTWADDMGQARSHKGREERGQMGCAVGSLSPLGPGF